MPAKKYDILAILGPTASGKTTLAAHLAALRGGEILSADSRQVYRRMDIGTGKDLNDYVVVGNSIPYHLIDIAEAGYKYNLFEYQRDFRKAYQSVEERGRLPILCGGTGLYLESIISGYRMTPVPENPELRARLANCSMEELSNLLASYKTLHNTTDTDTQKRTIRAIEIQEYYHTHPPVEGEDFPPLKSLIIGLQLERETRRRRITERLYQRLQGGMIEEVRRLIEEDKVSTDTLIGYGLEYKFITLYLLNKLSYNELVEGLNIAIHQFAKRQMTWFRGMERRGHQIVWINAEQPLEVQIAEVINHWDKAESAP